MSSSLNKPTSDPGQSSSSGFGFSWRAGKMEGPETVISSTRMLPPPGPLGESPSHVSGIIPRLFPSSQDAENVTGISIGHFTIQRRIGTGGMGSVFLALDERLKREVALKVLPPSLSHDQTTVQRFQNEAQAAARLDHDNIARVFYSGEENGLHYIAYEYVPGQNLRDVIRSKGWLDPAETVNYAIQLTAALHHSSNAGVIHRDIKPSNVLITPFGRAKLVDLGLARKASVESSLELTVPGTTLGTFDYISPEQARDPHKVDVRSDIYSLGCTVYHMLTGEPPYPQGTVLQKLLDHHDKDPPDPAKKNRRVSPLLSRVVRKMMASQPNHRYATPSELLRDLLTVARSLGAGAVPIDGQVWLTATRFTPPFWQSNFGWVATTCALCLMVTAVQLYPSLTQKAIHKTSIAEASKIDVREPHREVTADSVILKPPSDETRDTESNPPLTSNPMKSLVESSRTFNSRTASTQGSATGNETATASVSPPAPETMTPESPDAPPTIQNVNGRSYASLEAACAEASDVGTVIELRYNGVREPERPIRLGNKKIIIRAADGYHPVIRFAVTDTYGDESQLKMFTVAGGLLELNKVDLMMNIPNRISSDRWAMFSLERPEKVQLKDVTITLNNPFNKHACVFEQRAAVAGGLDNMGIRKDGTSVTPELLLTKCFVRGIGDFIVLRDVVPARYELKDVVVGVDGSLVQLYLSMDSMEIDRESLTLDMEHVTALLGQSLLAVDGSGGLGEKLPNITAFARNNIISCGPGRAMISMRGLPDFMDFQQAFSWRGNLNFYDNLETFLEVLTPELTGNRRWDFSYWKSFWSSNESVGSSNAAVVWRNKPLDRSFINLNRDSVELSAESAAARGAGGYAAGATLKDLRDPPPVEKIEK